MATASGHLRPSLPPWRARISLTVLLLLLSPLALRADGEHLQAPNYPAALKYSNDYLQQFVYSTAVRPNWIGQTDSFWYEYRTSKGLHFYRVNPKEATKEALFDRLKLGTQLSEMVQKPLDPALLPLTRVSLNDEGGKMKFVTDDFQYEYDLKADKLVKLGKAPPAPPQFGRGGGQTGRGRQLTDQRRLEQDTQQGDAGPGPRRQPGDYRVFSPDRKQYVFALKHNLYLAEADKEKDAVQLTRDGVEDYSFGGGTDDRKVRPLGLVTWAPDSKAFFVSRSDVRGVQDLFLVDSLASPRPALQKYKYPMPGEEHIRKTELHLFTRASNKLVPVPPKWKDEAYANPHWGKTADELRFVRRDRLRRHLEFCALNTVTSDCKCILAEGFENAYLEFQPVRYLDESSEMIWWSERSGWGHFYLYDRAGKLKNAITSGEYRASQIVAVDAKNRLLYFQGNAREKDENVYHQHLYCVRLDGTGLTVLDPGNAFHTSVLSPSRQYVVDNCSRVDMAPAALLCDAQGHKVMELERTDLSRLQEAGWKMPEAFMVKAADGVTDLYGNLWKPFDFDPKKKYPIIAHVYPGPQQEGVTHTFAAISAPQQLAQVGFIVVEVGHRGGAPTRSKAYHSYSYFNLRDYGLADKKAAIEQLAARHAFIDIARVGIYGHSGGGFMSAAAVLQKPYNEFFKAAVASAGNHDNNIYNNDWAERYHGLREIPVKPDDKKQDKVEEKKETKTVLLVLGANTIAFLGSSVGHGTALATSAFLPKPAEAGKDVKAVRGPLDVKFEIKVPTNAELAANLKGHLLLVHGEIDNNVHPANTMRLVDALIKANKRFDMLILPGKRHAFADYQPYVTQRTWEFFATHLLDDHQTGADIYEKNARAR